MKVFLLSLGLVGLSQAAEQLLTLLPATSALHFHPCDEPNLLSCRPVQVNFAAFQSDEILLPGGFTLHKVDTDDSAPEFLSLTYKDEAGSEATFTFAEGRAFGNANLMNGSDFVLEDCNNYPGCHVWKEEDLEAFGNHGEDDVLEIPAEYMTTGLNRADFTALLDKGKKDKTTVTTYSVKFYYTRQFKAVTDDIPLFIQQIVAETNLGYKQSNVPVRMKAHCVEAAELDDINSGSRMLTVFRNYKGTGVAGVTKLRGSADAAVLLVKKFNVCGIGYMRGWNGLPVSATQKGCSLGYYTVGHELGHNMGALHDKLQGANTYYSYGLGKHVGPDNLDGRGYMTIMAYPTSTHRREINYWSSSDQNIKFRDLYPTGTAEEDNARVLTETRFAFEAIGDESESCAGAAVTTAAPTTAAPTTAAPTTAAPTTAAPATTTSGSCSDSYDNCPAWASAGYCTETYNVWMSQNCQKSCNTCGGVCKDEMPGADCKAWKKLKYCKKGDYTEFMAQYCKKTCKKCKA